jgi:hypothetical protein
LPVTAPSPAAARERIGDCHGKAYDWVEALVITEEILLKIVLMLVATPGMIAPAATATNPAMSAYSMRS